MKEEKRAYLRIVEFVIGIAQPMVSIVDKTLEEVEADRKYWKEVQKGEARYFRLEEVKG